MGRSDDGDRRHALDHSHHERRLRVSIRKIELKAVGQEAVLHVDSCKLASVGKYPEVEFTGTDTHGILAMIVVNQKSTDRQLGRLALTYQTAVGQSLRFSRSDSGDPSKPFWDINFADPNDAPASLVTAGNSDKDTTVRLVSASADAGPGLESAPHPADRYEMAPGPRARADDNDGDDLYVSLTRDTLTNILPLYVKAGLPVSAEALGSMVATRFIAQTKRY